MGLRFRRHFQIAPGVRLNLSGGGTSFTLGPRGTSFNFGRRGMFFNFGIPGTGLYSRERIGGSSRRRTVAMPVAKPSAEQIKVPVTITLNDDGTLRFQDSNGQPLPPKLIARAKRQSSGEIKKWMEETCNTINAKVEALSSSHLHTRAPHERLHYEPQEFTSTKPWSPVLKPHGFLGWLFKPVRDRIDAENTRRKAKYDEASKEWLAEKAAFEERQRASRELLEARVLSDVNAMEEVLEGALKGITWPRETAVSAEINDGGSLVLLDVDLPEIQDMPKATASVSQSGHKLNIKEMSPKKIQQLYMKHVHGIAFRIIGEAFAVLPTAKEVVLSAYSQRPAKATAVVSDDYLYSVRVKREDWEKIDFTNLQAIDVVEALERFELRRDLTSAGVFQSVQPIAAGRSPA